MNPATLSHATFDPNDFDAISVQKEDDDFCVIDQVHQQNKTNNVTFCCQFACVLFLMRTISFKMNRDIEEFEERRASTEQEPVQNEEEEEEDKEQEQGVDDSDEDRDMDSDEEPPQKQAEEEQPVDNEPEQVEE